MRSDVRKRLSPRTLRQVGVLTQVRFIDSSSSFAESHHPSLQQRRDGPGITDIGSPDAARKSREIQFEIKFYN